MAKFNYNCGRTLQEVFDYFHIRQCDRDYIERILISKGYTPLGICYGVTKSEEKLLRFAGDPRLPNIFINEVCKNSLKSGDPRWESRKKK